MVSGPPEVIALRIVTSASIAEEAKYEGFPVVLGRNVEVNVNVNATAVLVVSNAKTRSVSLRSGFIVFKRCFLLERPRRVGVLSISQSTYGVRSAEYFVIHYVVLRVLS